MKNIKNILVAVDMSDEARGVVQRAMEIASICNASLHLIHVIEPVALNSPYEISPSLPHDIQSTLEQRAENYLEQLGQDLKLSDATHLICIGSIKRKIFQAAEEKGIDLIVVGTHGRHGIELLLGSTANAVLHGAPCDVYAVKL